MKPLVPVLHLYVMSRRIGVLLLIAFVAFAGRPLCPRGMSACFVAQADSHDCCGKRATLSVRDCCCKDGTRLAESNRGVDVRLERGDQAVLGGGFAVALPDPATLNGGLAFATSRRGHGPPDTPVNRHTTLLL